MHPDDGFHDHAGTVMVIAWGQFMDHDYTLTATPLGKSLLRFQRLMTISHSHGTYQAVNINLIRRSLRWYIYIYYTHCSKEYFVIADMTMTFPKKPTLQSRSLYTSVNQSIRERRSDRDREIYIKASIEPSSIDRWLHIHIQTDNSRYRARQSCDIIPCIIYTCVCFSRAKLRRDFHFLLFSLIYVVYTLKPYKRESVYIPYNQKT